MELAQETKTEEPIQRFGGQFKLRKADGTVLAKCPTRKAGWTTAQAMADNFHLEFGRNGQWRLVNQDGTLLFTIGR